VATTNPIVLCHGITATRRQVVHGSRALERAGHRVVSYDARGHGESDPAPPGGGYGYPSLVGDLERVVAERLGEGRLLLAGHSMGAHTAVAFALANPTRVGKLVLMGGGVSGPSLFVPQPTEGIKLIGALYRQPTIENLKKMLGVFVYDSSMLTDDLVRARLDNMLSQPEHLENFVKSAEANPKQFPDVGHRLGEIKAPTLLVWGRDDRFVPMDVGLRLLAGLQNVEMHVFSRCGHWAQWEHADKFNRLVLDFLAR
jgi:2-hydroxy-6-oxonona-2,4-dienedioate hydrolase